MAEGAEAALTRLGIVLPDPPNPAGSYVPCRQSGQLLFVSGQISLAESGLIAGKLGDDLDVEAGAAAARVCALNLLAQVRAHCGGTLDRVAGCLQLAGFVNATPEFTDHPKVLNGASELIAAVLGEGGRHTRAAVGMSSLPLGCAVEISGVFELAAP